MCPGHRYAHGEMLLRVQRGNRSSGSQTVHAMHGTRPVLEQQHQRSPRKTENTPRTRCTGSGEGERLPRGFLECILLLHEKQKLKKPLRDGDATGSGQKDAEDLKTTKETPADSGEARKRIEKGPGNAETDYPPRHRYFWRKCTAQGKQRQEVLTAKTEGVKSSMRNEHLEGKKLGRKHKRTLGPNVLQHPSARKPENEVQGRGGREQS